tara:strand:- start:66 stop:1304 length:1239 start_codon:yes stop_codon:yes gene_type:complete
MDRFEEIYSRYEAKELTCEAAAELLHCDERTFRRKRDKYLIGGIESILDKRLSQVPHNKIPVDKLHEILTLKRDDYEDYNASHFYEEASIYDKYGVSYSWLRSQFNYHGTFKIGKKHKKKHRKKRERRPMVGMMIHQDGSTHKWFDGDDNYYDLIITMDDANNEIYSAFLCNEEGTQSSFRGIMDVINNKGVFSVFYVDRGAHYGHTNKAGDKVDLSKPTQVARALKQLGIHIIYAKSPQARGRSERMFRTWQDRLPQELKSHNINNIEDANKFITNQFLPKMNKRFIKESKLPDNGFMPYVGRNIEEVLSIQTERKVNNDNTVSYNSKILQIPQSKYRFSYAGSKVIVHQYLDESIEIFHGLHSLGKFNIKDHYQHLEHSNNIVGDRTALPARQYKHNRQNNLINEVNMTI